MLKSLFQTPKDTQIFKYLLLLSGLFVLPIALADFTYEDDNLRVFTGANWNSNGRIFGSVIYKILTFSNKYSLNLSPYGLGFFILISGINTYLLYKVFLQSLSTICIVILSVIFIFNPFSLQNISFKFDVIPMSIAYLFSFLSFYILHKKGNNILYILVVFLLLVLLLLAYQPFITIFVALCFIYTIFPSKENSRKKILFLAKASLITIIAFITYNKIATPYISGWIKSHNEIISLNKEALIITKNNIQSIYTLINTVIQFEFPISARGLLFYIPIILGYTIGLVETVKMTKNNRSIFSLFILVLYTLSPIGLFIIITLSILPLVDPVLTPRVVPGASLFTFFYVMLIFIFLKKSWIKNIVLIFIAYSSLYLISIPFAYGTLLKVKKEWNKSLFQSIGNHLFAEESYKTINTLVLISPPYESEESNKIFKSYPFINQYLLSVPMPYVSYLTKSTPMLAKSNIKTTYAFYKKNSFEKAQPELFKTYSNLNTTIDSTRLFTPIVAQDSILVLNFDTLK